MEQLSVGTKEATPASTFTFKMSSTSKMPKECERERQVDGRAALVNLNRRPEALL
jgi:hypothetical protein